jgi:hypothetical protein
MWENNFDSMSLSQNLGCKHKSETSYTRDDITRQVEKHVFGKDVRRMSDQSPPFGRKSTPLVTVRAFAVVFSRMSFRIRCPVLQVSLPEVYDKTAEINRFTVLQLLLKAHDCVRPSMAERIWADQLSWIFYSAACQHVRPSSL